eukprot:scaffold13219_cov61-Attheya_sp.AAC.4
MFYKAVVQSILLFVSEAWVVTKPMLQALKGFHSRVARQLSGKTPHFCHATYEWIYPPTEKALEEVGLWPIEKYIESCQNAVVDYVATWPIFELCTEAEWPTGSQSSRRWWDQVDRDYEGAIEAAEFTDLAGARPCGGGRRHDQIVAVGYQYSTSIK